MTFSFQLEKKSAWNIFPVCIFKRFGTLANQFSIFSAVDTFDFLVQKFVKPKKSFQQKKLFIKKN